MRRARRSERGQSALMAVIGLIILAIGMYTTYNLSRSIYEKIKLQNAADAAAYSLATLEARTFNYIAFANRAQVANYVQMLEMQSLLSSATFVEGYAGFTGDVALTTARFIKQVCVAMPYCAAAVAAANVLEGVGVALEATFRAAKALIGEPGSSAGLDGYVPLYIRVKTAANNAFFATQIMIALATMTQLIDGASEIIAQNDPNAEQHPLTLAIRGFNTASYLAAFDFASWSPGGGGADNKEAKRIMTELVNATRYSTGPFGESFIITRQPFEMLEGLVGFVMPANRFVRLGNITSLIGGLLAPGFKATSKLLADGSLQRVLEDTGQSSYGHSGLAEGDTLVAKDQPGIDMQNFAAVVSGKEGYHCRYYEPKGYGRPEHIVELPTAPQTDFKCDDDVPRSHAWKNLIGKGGVQPYMNFAADREGLSSEDRSFNQPDVWVWLRKRPESMAMAGTVPDLQFRIDRPQERAQLDARIGEEGMLGLGILEGMNAVARAQVYYHRPGAWNEPPNFFNPFWGGRLARKSAAVDRLLQFMPPQIANVLADNIWMH